MNGGVAAGSPAGTNLQLRRMVHVADIDLLARCLDLSVATQAEIRIALDQHFLVDGAVRGMASDAAFAHGRMLKDVRPRLIAMALGATFILSRHGQASCRPKDIAAMGIMALDATHVAFNYRMMLREIELSVDVEMALKTGRRVLTRIDDEIGAAGLDVTAAGSMAGFAPGLAGQGRRSRMNSGMRTGGKYADDFLVTISTSLVPHEMRARNLQRRADFRGGGTGI